MGLRRHAGNARAAARLIDRLTAEARSLPEDAPARDAWREGVRARLQEFGAARLGWPDGYRRLAFGDGYFDASVDFARQARAFDPTLPLNNLWQAMRNVWIGNSLQMLLDRPVRSRPGLFAYSMLYPLTDNLLDDPQVGGAAKRGFNERFGHRLSGLRVQPSSDAEAAVFQLVTMVEDEFPRSAHGDVHDSLLAIHRGQVRSLTQQDDLTLTDRELLAISCEKGGTSVLADLYLVAAKATPGEERFAFGYGVALQLMDDLQDVVTDAAAGHQTLFTRAARHGRLDAATSRLLRFIDRVLDEDERFARPDFAERKDLLRRNCRSLVVGAIADQPALFSWRFRRHIARQWPFSLGAMRRLRRRAQRRFAETERELRRRTGARSLVDWLLTQS